MNLLDILRSRSANLPEGEYTLGINAVVQHIDVATKHLLRGQETTDETAFTDAIYRTNQAFEGSLKEAYRVLAGKDPAHETANNIESYLQQQNLLRPRVLAQFTNYRREWRNPSTHDYRLDFDEDEALLAIVTVAAFAIVLIDQGNWGSVCKSFRFCNDLHTDPGLRTTTTPSTPTIPSIACSRARMQRVLL